MKYYLPKALLYNLISPDYPAAALANLKAALLSGIASEADWGPNQVAGPIIRWTEYSHGNIGAGKAWATTQIEQLGPGKPSPFFEAMDNASQDGCVLVRGSGDSTSLGYIEGQMDIEWQEPSRQVLVVLAGGDVVGVPVWFEFNDPDAICPLGDGVETWRQWKQGAANSEPSLKGEKWYRSSCDYSSSTNSGEPLSASQWVPKYLTGEVTVISAQSLPA